MSSPLELSVLHVQYSNKTYSLKSNSALAKTSTKRMQKKHKKSKADTRSEKKGKHERKFTLKL